MDRKYPNHIHIIHTVPFKGATRCAALRAHTSSWRCGRRNLPWTMLGFHAAAMRKHVYIYIVIYIYIGINTVY